MESYHTIYRGQTKRIIFITLIVGLLVGGLTFLFPLKYSATTRLLITQRAAFTLDPYTAVRSVELIGDNLAQIVGTSFFLDKVLSSGYAIDKAYFSSDEIQRRRQWSQMASAQMLRGTGILEIVIYHPDKDQTTQIANAVIFVLNREGSDYMGRDIGIRLVDAPILSRFPVKPSVPLNALAGLFFGFLLGHLSGYVTHRKRKHHGEMI